MFACRSLTIEYPKNRQLLLHISYLAFPARVDWCGDSVRIICASNRHTKSEAERIVVRVSTIMKIVGGQKRFVKSSKTFRDVSIIHSLRRI